MHRHELTDDQWSVVEPLVPRSTARTGRPASDRRLMLDGLFCQTLLAWATGPAATREEALAVLTARVDSLLPSLLA